MCESVYGLATLGSVGVTLVAGFIFPPAKVSQSRFGRFGRAGHVVCHTNSNTR